MPLGRLPGPGQSYVDVLRQSSKNLVTISSTQPRHLLLLLLVCAALYFFFVAPVYPGSFPSVLPPVLPPSHNSTIPSDFHSAIPVDISPAIPTDIPPAIAIDIPPVIPSASESLIHDDPPEHIKIYQWEADLPQHNLDLPFPEGATGRYVKFSNQIKMLGWNNVFNEILMNTHLAYESNRSYVFQDYVWKPEYYPWKKPVPGSSRQWPPHTPLNAIISGPTAGGLWDEGDDAPRSVSEAWFDVVCPQSERRIINTQDVKPAVEDSPGDEIFAHWRTLLQDAPERCIEIVPAPEADEYPQTFDLWLWGSDRILSLWESFSQSPTSRLLATSPLVNSAVDRNEYLFTPRGPRPSIPTSRNPYDRMMAMHIRRGDFKKACTSLARWNSTYYSWNLLPFLPDKFTPPPGGSVGANTPENIDKYLEHCLPDMEMIVQKVRDAKLDYIAVAKPKYRTLEVMYLLTNEEGEWLSRLKDALRLDGWHTIVTTKDLELDQEQQAVNMAVDMDIARRAAVFIGNGWSSFTSNVVHRRLVDRKLPISNRFW